jgi:hypothetical protein
MLKAISIETATISAQYSASIIDDRQMQALLSVKSTQTTATASAPAAKAADASDVSYKVGDTGPAGGIIFYAKSSKSDGWQYLEAAPAETESAMKFRGFNRSNDRKTGAGKQNTKIIMEYLEKSGGAVNTAVWYCDQLELNGFDDWYCPSRDELLYMYTNLKKKGLGEFMNERYWSSETSSGSHAYNIHFGTGKENFDNGNDYEFRVRAVRQF